MPKRNPACRARRHSRILLQCKRTTLDQFGKVCVVAPVNPVTMGRKLSKDVKTMSEKRKPEVFHTLRPIHSHQQTYKAKSNVSRPSFSNAGVILPGVLNPKKV